MTHESAKSSALVSEGVNSITEFTYQEKDNLFVMNYPKILVILIKCWYSSSLFRVSSLVESTMLTAFVI